MVHQPPLWVPIPEHLLTRPQSQPQPQPQLQLEPQVHPQLESQVQPQVQPPPQPEPQPQANPQPHTVLESWNLDELFYQSEPEYESEEELEEEPCEKSLVNIPMEPFPFAHLLVAVNHEIDHTALTWRPPNETPVKGQSYFFETLPYDIQFDVAQYLDYPTIVRLKRTNRYFHKLFNPRTILPQSDVAEFVKARDSREIQGPKTTFACYGCWKFLPKTKFTRKAMKSKDDRFCFDCAAEMRWYPHLCPVSNGKLKYYFCHNCGTYATESARCRGTKPVFKNIHYDFREPYAANDLCTKKATRILAQLEILPIHLLQNVAKFLTYKDLLRFTQVSNALNEKIDHDWAPLHDRFRCVYKRWEEERKQEDFETIKNFPCFLCLEWKPRAKFTKTQIKKAETFPETSWKLRCQSCLHYQYSTGKNPLRVEYRRRQMCEICRCVKAAGTTCGGCLELYLNGMIDRETVFPLKPQTDFDYQEHLYGLEGVFLEEEVVHVDDEVEEDEESGYSWWDLLGFGKG